MAINTDAVQRLYVAYFNRPADPVGLLYWESKLPSTTVATQAQLTTLAAGFSGSAEYAALYAGQSNSQIVNNLYLNLFGRAAEPAGLAHWAGKLTDGSETFASIALQLTYSAQGTDATAIANKLSAANTFTTALVTADEIAGYSGTAAAASARSWLATVTDVPATLTTATAAAGVAAAVSAAVAAGTADGGGGGGAGLTFTLTTSADNFTGTSSADTFNAVIDQATPANSTINATDVISGGAGTDTLNITPTVDVALIPADSIWSGITGIEKIVIATTATGAQAITGPLFDAAFKAAGVDLTTTSTSGAIAIDMNSFTGAATLTTISLTGAQTIVTGSGVATVTATSTTGAHLISGANLATVTSTSTTGAQNITTGAGTGVATVNATSTTGAVTVTTGAGADVVTVTTSASLINAITTGAGNDTITIANTGDAGASAYTITGGLGADTINLALVISADTIVIGNTDSGITVALADRITGFATATDSLKMGTAGVGGNYVEAGAAVTDFAAALAAANTALAGLAGGAEKYSFQWDATNGYLFDDIDGNGTADQVVVLTGITGATIAVGDIIA